MPRKDLQVVGIDLKPFRAGANYNCQEQSRKQNRSSSKQHEGGDGEQERMKGLCVGGLGASLTESVTREKVKRRWKEDYCQDQQRKNAERFEYAHVARRRHRA